MSIFLQWECEWDKKGWFVLFSLISSERRTTPYYMVGSPFIFVGRKEMNFPCKSASSHCWEVFLKFMVPTQQVYSLESHRGHSILIMHHFIKSYVVGTVHLSLALSSWAKVRYHWVFSLHESPFFALSVYTCLVLTDCICKYSNADRCLALRGFSVRYLYVHFAVLVLSFVK